MNYKLPERSLRSRRELAEHHLKGARRALVEGSL